jgi:ribose-phosphate pyrophosphokinase
MDGPMIAVFTGNANPQLAQDIARYLQVPLGRAHVGRFSDGEVTGRVDGERARARCVHRAADVPASERSPDGIAGHGRCVPPCLGRAHHRR